MLAQKQPPFKECVIAHWSRGFAPKMSGAKAQNRSRVSILKVCWVGERSIHDEGIPKGVLESIEVRMPV